MDDITTRKILSPREEIFALARAHSVSYQPTALDHLGNAITRLAGDDVQLDDAQLLLLALLRANVITKEVSADLRARYIRAKHE